MDRLNDSTCPISTCKNTVKLQIGESIVTLTFTGKSTENTRAKLVALLSEAYSERVKSGSNMPDLLLGLVIDKQRDS